MERVEVYNLYGQLVKPIQCSVAALSIPLPSGLYVVRVTFTNGEGVAKKVRVF